MFYYNLDKYNFNSILDVIKKYYPIGLAEDYYKYPGLKELSNIIVNKVHDENNFQKTWREFEDEIRIKTGKPVIGTTSGQSPCFSAFIDLGKFTTDNLTRLKELEFFVSHTGPFYTVVGVDRNEIKISDKKIHSNNFLAVSPEADYKDCFALVCELIEARFKNFKFVPFFIYSQEVHGLSEQYKREQDINTVFNTLFNGHIKFNIQTIGNEYFYDKSWIKEGYEGTSSGWTMYP